jgi:hypothetical protein
MVFMPVWRRPLKQLGRFSFLCTIPFLLVACSTPASAVDQCLQQVMDDYDGSIPTIERTLPLAEQPLAKAQAAQEVADKAGQCMAEGGEVSESMTDKLDSWSKRKGLR